MFRFTYLYSKVATVMRWLSEADISRGATFILADADFNRGE